MKTLTLLLILLIPTIKLVGQSEGNLINANLNKLSKGEKLNNKYKILEEDRTLKSYYEEYKKNPNSENYSKMLNQMTVLSLSKDIKYDVIIKTKTPGAYVRYRSKIDPNSSMSSKQTNDCLIRLPIGKCIIWTERGGKKTSKEREIIVLNNDIIEIEETDE